MIKAGIVGCGGIARAHAQGYRATGKAELTAFCDVELDRAKAFADEFGGQAYGSPQEMLKKGVVDVVSVCTPPSSHEEHTCRALEAGLHVCCEKPLAHTSASAAAMVQCAKDTGNLLVTAFKFRFFPNVLWAKNLIDSGKAGTVVFARNIFAGHIDMSERWFSKKDISGGGVMLDNGVHSIDLLRFLFGEVQGVFAVVRNAGKPLEVEDSCRLMLNMSSGTWASVDLTWVAGQSANFLEIHGTEGLIELQWGGGAFTPKTGNGAQEHYTAPTDPVLADPFSAQLDWFIDCVLGEREPRATANDGLRALEVVDTAYASAEQPAWKTK